MTVEFICTPFMLNFIASMLVILTIVLQGLAVIFALMIFIISSKRRFLGIVTMGTVFDASLAYMLSSILVNTIRWTEYHGSYSEMNWTSQVIIVFLMLPCMSLRISLWWIFMNKIDSWDNASSAIRVCYVIHFLLSSMIGLLIFIHCIALALWFIWMYFSFLWNLIKWLLWYPINQGKLIILGNNFMNNAAVKFRTATNFSKLTT